MVPMLTIGPPINPLPVPTLVTVPPELLSGDGAHFAPSYLSTCPAAAAAVAPSGEPLIRVTVALSSGPARSPPDSVERVTVPLFLLARTPPPPATVITPVLLIT